MGRRLAVRVPATTANLGSGFDCVGMAFDWYDELTVEVLENPGVVVEVTGEGADARAEVALLDLEKCRRRISCQRAAANDLKQLRRHSSWNDADWKKLLYFYEVAFGSAVKGLE